ncbi:hypothetical protein FIU83_08245 [Halomonas sp. THAF5a]|uniref:DUF3306 domain-containing protein n=1 Tax=Halomonas sp. THAF5a TaxID=2587844 RepID=UPI001268E496|nr:DUF3306 domain-containing protein [Halomonas sp. THAF5a]QFU01625.1 hypothetical protein FIU83_08245 [Halomonas sp. THAF5a]
MSRLERWSRRKRGETEETPPEPEAAVPGEATHAPLNAAPETADGEPEPGSLDHTLPDPDTLPPGSDIKAYLASGVSAGLRRRALRRLFAASHYGVRDGLDDYDDDFREKLKPLAEDVAERLRQWTRREAEGDDEVPGDEAPEQVASRATDGDDQDAREPAPQASDPAPDADIAHEAEAPDDERRE